MEQVTLERLTLWEESNEQYPRVLDTHKLLWSKRIIEYYVV